MLLNLHVKNFALIDEIDMEFGNGLNILTGETGAGKSIILGSLNIALGAKADKELIRTGSEYALVELTFSANNRPVLEKLKEHEIEAEDNIVLIQRKILPNRSVFKINGETVNNSVVKDIASVLIDVYGQHDYQNLLNSKKHLDFLDSFAQKDINKALEEYRKSYNLYNDLQNKIKALEDDPSKREREVSLLQYQINEIEAASLKEDEEEEVSTRLKSLENSSKIQNSLGSVNFSLFEGDVNASSLIDSSLRELSTISEYDSKIEKLLEELNDISASVSELERESRSLYDEFSPDEKSLFELRERYELINDLERKYGRTIAEVLSYKEDKEKELEALYGFEENKKELEVSFEKAKDKISKDAEKLTKLRQKYAKEFSDSMVKALGELNFNQSKFEVKVEDLDSYTPNGKDNVSFVISTNPGEPLKNLENVSSGGELSRIMLALKSISADKENTESLIFDEIDSGISGVTAWTVAKKLALLSKNHQIICITHLQQIAAMADSHYEIVKSVSKDSRTNTSINSLDEDGRIKEISRMLGDDKASDTFKDNAVEILRQAEEYKKSL